METNKGSMVENISKQGCFSGYINEYKYVNTEEGSSICVCIWVCL